MASTITRDILVDDTGTAEFPNEDGTLIGNDTLQDNIYARVDEMFAGAGAYSTFTLGGNLTLEGGNLSVVGTAAISSNATVGGTLGVNGATTMSGLVVAADDPISEINVQGAVVNARRWLSQGLSGGSGSLRHFAASDDLTAQFNYDTLTRLGPSITGRLLGLATGGTGFQVAVGGGGTTVRLTVSDTAITPSVRINSAIGAQPGFLATGVGQGITAVTADVDFSEVYDEVGNFSSNTFTAPVTGRYLLCVAVLLENTAGSNNTVTLHLVTSNRTYPLLSNATLVATTGIIQAGLPVFADMDAGDTAVVRITGANTNGAIASQGSHFSGRLVP